MCLKTFGSTAYWLANLSMKACISWEETGGGGGGGVGEGEGVGVGVGGAVGVGEGTEARPKTLPARYEAPQTIAVSMVKETAQRKYLRKDFIGPNYNTGGGGRKFSKRNFFLFFLGFGKAEAVFAPIAIRILLGNGTLQKLGNFGDESKEAHHILLYREKLGLGLKNDVFPGEAYLFGANCDHAHPADLFGRTKDGIFQGKLISMELGKEF